MNDLDKILDKLCEDPAFVRAYREERITWELQARAVCRYLRGEVERLELREVHLEAQVEKLENIDFELIRKDDCYE